MSTMVLDQSAEAELSPRDMLELRVEGLLYELGRSPEEMAESLCRRGIRGERGSLDDCVLVRYLRSELRGNTVVIAAAEGMGLEITVQARGQRAYVIPTHQQEQFIAAFDRGCYRFLEPGFRGALARLRRRLG